jgi:hypothetical protein
MIGHTILWQREDREKREEEKKNHRDPTRAPTHRCVTPPHKGCCCVSDAIFEGDFWPLDSTAHTVWMIQAASTRCNLFFSLIFYIYQKIKFSLTPLRITKKKKLRWKKNPTRSFKFFDPEGIQIILLYIKI